MLTSYISLTKIRKTSSFTKRSFTKDTFR